jgi:hypothetical protein
MKERSRRPAEDVVEIGPLADYRRRLAFVGKIVEAFCGEPGRRLPTERSHLGLAGFDGLRRAVEHARLSEARRGDKQGDDSQDGGVAAHLPLADQLKLMAERAPDPRSIGEIGNVSMTRVTDG